MLRKLLAKFAEGADPTHADGGGRATESGGDLLVAELFEMTEANDLLIVGRKGVERLGQQERGFAGGRLLGGRRLVAAG